MPDHVQGVFPACVDNSMRKALVRCQKSAYWKYERGLVSIEDQRVHLDAGKAFAAGICAARVAHYDGGADPFETVRIGLEALRAAYNYKGVMPAYCYKTLDRMEGALVFYLEKWPFADDHLTPVRLNNGKLALEMCFGYTIPVLHPTTGRCLTHVANFDMLAQDMLGRLWVVDEKTTGKMGDAWAMQWTLDAQLTGYCHAAKLIAHQNGIDAEVAGTIIRGIAIHKADYAGMECLEPRQPWEIERWYQQMLRDMADWAERHTDGQHQMVMDHACALYNSPCEYSKLCKAHDPERLIDGSYVVHRYDPTDRD